MILIVNTSIVTQDCTEAGVLLVAAEWLLRQIASCSSYPSIPALL
jgi:hypothetical protein